MFAECADCRWWPCSLRTKRCLTNPPTYGPSCRYMLQQLTNTKTDRYRHQQEMDHRSRLVKMSPNSITCLFSAAIDVITCEQLVQNSSVNSSQNALSPKIELVFICHKTSVENDCCMTYHKAFAYHRSNTSLIYDLQHAHLIHALLFLTEINY